MWIIKTPETFGWSLAGVKGSVDLKHNQLKVLLEEVWKPLFMEDVGLYAEGEY